MVIHNFTNFQCPLSHVDQPYRGESEAFIRKRDDFPFLKLKAKSIQQMNKGNITEWKKYLVNEFSIVNHF